MAADIVIVGAGSAGCVLAGRLTEDPDCSVLLLEAGGSDRSMNVRIPAAFPKLFKSERDWGYDTEPVEAAGGRRVFCPRGRTLGGSSSINAQMFVRGNHLDYDGWAEAGNAGWSWDDVLPLFKRSEQTAFGTPALRGTEGPLHVQGLRDPSPLTAAAIRAMVDHGIPANDDYNGPTQDGVGPIQASQRRGRRWSAADAFLHPARRRPNLEVVTDALVTGVVVADGTARAVRYVVGGVEHEVEARREVVLAAGAIGSPQLLLLSGIGPADHLADLGIEVTVDLPGVGANLQDHASIAYIATITEPISLLAAESPIQLAKYVLARKGMLTSNVGEATAFVRVDAYAPAPDVQLVVAPVEYIDHGLQPPPGHGLTIGAVLLTPESRGRIRLRSTDPAAAPAIDAAYLSDPGGHDLRRLLAGLRLCREIVAQPALQHHVDAEYLPGPDRISDDELTEHVHEHLFALYHPVGTCAMGTGDQAVVDPALRVRGVERLRVVDASIMPTITRGNTNAPAIMIGEKGAELLRSAP